MMLFALVVLLVTPVYLVLAITAYKRISEWPVKRVLAHLMVGLVLVAIHVGGMMPTLLVYLERGSHGRVFSLLTWGLLWAPPIWLIISVLCLLRIRKGKGGRLKDGDSAANVGHERSPGT